MKQKAINHRIISVILVVILLFACVFSLTGCFLKTFDVDYVFMVNEVEFERQSVKVSTLVKTSTYDYKKPQNDASSCEKFAYWEVEDKYKDIVTVGNYINVETDTLADGDTITFNAKFVIEHSWSIWTSIKEPIKDGETGVKERSCNICNVKEERQYPYGDDVQSDDINLSDNANGKYAYEDIKKSVSVQRTQAKVNNMLKMYDRFEVVCKAFFDNDTNARYFQSLNCYYVDIIDITDLGLSQHEMLEVYSAFTYDTPLYYFISKNIYFNIGYPGSKAMNNIMIAVDDEYFNGLKRANYRDAIITYLADYISIVAGKKLIYQKVAAINDKMIRTVTYTNSGKPAAHNIIGIVAGEGPVCESYAKTFSLIMNYFDLESIYVSGGGGNNYDEPHAWNLTKLDDGKYYWIDTTWNDTNDDDKNTRKFFAKGNVSFRINHKPSTPGISIDNGVVSYMYELPTVPDSNFNWNL